MGKLVICWPSIYLVHVEPYAKYFASWHKFTEIRFTCACQKKDSVCIIGIEWFQSRVREIAHLLLKNYKFILFRNSEYENSQLPIQSWIILLLNRKLESWFYSQLSKASAINWDRNNWTYELFIMFSKKRPHLTRRLYLNDLIRLLKHCKSSASKTYLNSKFADKTFTISLLKLFLLNLVTPPLLSARSICHLLLKRVVFKFQLKLNSDWYKSFFYK